MTEDQFFFKLKQQYSHNLPFVVYSSPKSSGTTKALLQKNPQLFQVKDFTESGFVFAPFDNQKEVILIPENASEKLIFEQKTDSEFKVRGDAIPSSPADGEKRRFIRLVEKAIQILQTGEMDKVVLSRQEVVTLSDEEPFALFLDLLKNYPTAFVYCWYHPKVGLWLGATPETLLKVEGNRFETMALAGTQIFRGSMDVEWREKEKQEQQFVTDSILQNLTGLGITSGVSQLNTGTSRSGSYTAKAGNLLHLRTDISGKLNSVEGLKELILSLHPTPAVCGLPKEKAKEFIIREENYDREFYTGFLGEMNFQQVTQRSRSRRNVENLAYRSVKKETSLFVNLRCMKIENGKAILFIGGGITKDSVPEEEWQETVNKAGTMKKVLLK